MFQTLFGDPNEKKIQQYSQTINGINKLEEKIKNLTDSELQNQTNLFIQRLSTGEKIENLLVESFAVVREASRRVLGLRHFDVQLIGGLILHEGKIAEMRTGEGKTLVAVLPAYVNALTGKGVHVVTVNDYLAARDAEYVGQIHKFLGLSVGLIQQNMTQVERKLNYSKDITYTTNSELGFDYLRDNMCIQLQDIVQRPFYFSILDEVDSILIDEARTPLIISGAGETPNIKYTKANLVAQSLVRDIHYEVDEKAKNVLLTEEGVIQAELQLNVNDLYDVDNPWAPYVFNAIKAKELFIKNVNYIVKDQEVLIVDEFTGRIMIGRRWSDGLHQAIEAKENVKIEAATQTFATITLQNYFRMYSKLGGMTGTAVTEAGEFWEIYKLDVVEIPTNKPMARKDKDDLIYRTVREKFNAVIEDVVELSNAGRPVLIGTTSVEISELLSRMLKIRGIQHNVLNAKMHKREAEIVAEAGKPGVVTIATNMAGRGTDIKLSDEVKKAGGLAIIGTERHDSRRVDRQLRGRAGRQGDVGSSQFYVSLEDNLMRLFGSERVAKVMDRIGLKEGEVIQHSMMTKSIERAQKKVEENNFGVRKRLLEYDDVMNAQREVVYKRRRHALHGERLKVDIANMMYDTCELVVEQNKAAADFKNYEFELIRYFSISSPISEAEFGKLTDREITRKTYKAVLDHYNEKIARNAAEAFPIIKNVYENNNGQYLRIIVPFTDGIKTLNVVTDLEKAYTSQGKTLVTDFEKNITLAIVDEAWKKHLRKMDELKQSVQLAVHEQKDPLLIYKFEAFNLFKKMIDDVNKEVISFLFKGNLPSQNPSDIHEAKQVRQKQNYTESKQDLDGDDAANEARRAGEMASQRPNVTETITRETPKINRNDTVTIKHVMSGKSETMKYKKAESMIASGEWVLVNE